MKKTIKIGVAVLALAMTTATLGGCNGKASEKKNYLDEINSYAFWENDLSEAIPQPNIGKMVLEFLDTENTDGKAKKVAFIGYDGCRADALITALKSGAQDKKGNDFSGDKDKSMYSGIGRVLDQGGHLYMAHAGGYTKAENEQHTSTAPGWASLTTGVWGIENGITNNGMPKNMEYKTFMLKAAEEKGMRGAFIASWEPHFTENYTPEMEYVEKNKDIPMTYKLCKDDAETFDYYMDCLTVGSPNEKDVIFATIEATDHNGHGTEFGNHNYKYVTGFRDEDEMAYKLIDHIQNRSTYDQEDWLIVITTDHGGLGRSHGGQSVEERSTWVVCNKPIDKKYYSDGYDGHKIKK